MFVSQTVLGYLDRCDVDFDVVSHRRSHTAAQSARTAHIDPHVLAKAVVLRDPEHYVLAAVPADRKVNPWAVEELIDTTLLRPAREHELPWIFRDCERGAVPVVGEAFGMETVIDDDLLRADEVYFEAGDHEHLIHLHGPAFVKLVLGSRHGAIAA